MRLSLLFLTVILVLAASAPEAAARQISSSPAGDELCTGTNTDHEAAAIDAHDPEEPVYAVLTEKHKDPQLRLRRLADHARQDTACADQSPDSDHPISSFLEQLTHLPRAP